MLKVDNQAALSSDQVLVAAGLIIFTEGVLIVSDRDLYVSFDGTHQRTEYGSRIYVSIGGRKP